MKICCFKQAQAAVLTLLQRSFLQHEEHYFKSKMNALFQNTDVVLAL